LRFPPQSLRLLLVPRPVSLEPSQRVAKVHPRPLASARLERMMSQQKLVPQQRTDLPQMTSVPKRPTEIAYGESYQRPIPRVEGEPLPLSERVPTIQGEAQAGVEGIEAGTATRAPQKPTYTQRELSTQRVRKELRGEQPVHKTGPRTAGEPYVVETPPVKKPTIRQKERELRQEAKDITLGAVRTRKVEIEHNNRVADDWEKVYTTHELEDAGALIEGVGNLQTGRKPVSTKRLRSIQHKAEDTFERMRREINTYLKDVGDDEYIKYIEDYLPHFYRGNKKIMATHARNWVRSNSPNAKRRYIPTLEDAKKMGLEPISQNAADLTRMWSRINWQVATTKKLVHDVKGLKIDGLPVMSTEKRPGWALSENVAVRAMFGGRPAYVHPEVWKPLRNVVENPMSNNFVASVETFNAYAKRAALSLSFFHHMALTESAVAGLGWKGLPIPTTISQKTGKLTRPHKIGLEMLEKSDFYEDAIMHGLQLGDPMDLLQLSRFGKTLEQMERGMKSAGMVGLPTAMKGVRKFTDVMDKGLWHKYYRGLKAHTYNSLLEENLNLAISKGYTTKRAKEEIAAVVNNMYGGQEWEAFMQLGPVGQQVMHWSMLAPDWTISNLKIAGEPMRKSWLRRKIGRKYWRNMAAFMFVETQGANMALNQRPTWENEKGHEFDVDITEIIRKLPWIDDKGKKGRYYAHGFKQVREAFGWVGMTKHGIDLSEPIKQIGRKASPLLQTMVEQLTASSMSGFPMDWKERNGYKPRQLETIPLRGKAIGRKFLPFSLSGNNFAFTLPLSKGMTPYKYKTAVVTALRYFAEPSLVDKAIRSKYTGDDMLKIIDDYFEAAELNALDAEMLTTQAISTVRTFYEDKLYKAEGEDNAERVEKYENILDRLETPLSSIIQSLNRRDELADIEPIEPERWKKQPAP